MAEGGNFLRPMVRAVIQGFLEAEMAGNSFGLSF
jgi:hypothetical protein